MESKEIAQWVYEKEESISSIQRDELQHYIDEYAQQRAVDFAEWVEDNTVFCGEYTIFGHSIHMITKPELYQIFLNEKQK